MAIKTLMLRKKIDDKRRALEKLTAARSEIETRGEELKTREAELEESINEAETDEEKAAVEEAVEAYENDKAALETDQAENAEAIENLENEVKELEADLAESESRMAEVAELPAEKEETPVIKRSIAKENIGMIKTRTFRNMTLADREAFVQREDVQATLAQVRELMANKRSISGADYTIGTSVLGLIRENVMEYSKLYSRVNVFTAKGNGRVIVQGVAPEAIWMECCDALQEVSITFGQIELDCYKVGAYFGICNATIEDSDIDLLDALMVAIMQGLGLAIDKAILYGTGTKMPTGVITAIADDATLAGTNLIKITGSPTGTALISKIIEASGNANSDYSRGEKVWAMNEKTYTTLLSNAVTVDGAGAIVAGVNGKMPVVGGDIIVLNFIPDNNIIVGYFDLYTLLERAGMTVETSEHAKFIEDQLIMRAKARMDGKPAVVKAFAGIGLGVDPSTTVDFAGES